MVVEIPETGLDDNSTINRRINAGESLVGSLFRMKRAGQNLT
jgi:hypothetical protein